MQSILGTSGRLFDPEENPPPFRELLEGLARTRRFGGKGDRAFQDRWNVLKHSVGVALALEDALPDDAGVLGSYVRAAILHDSYEYFTGDVPTPFKTASLRIDENRFLERIGGAPPTPGAHYLIKDLDATFLRAEAAFLWPGLTDATLDEHFGEIQPRRLRAASEIISLLSSMDDDTVVSSALKFLED